MLVELLREAERVIDQQVRAMEHLDHEAERVIALGVAGLAAAAAIAALGADENRLLREPIVATAFVVGGIMNGVSILVLIDAYLGFGSKGEAHVGPRLEWLASKAVDESWSDEDHLASLLLDYSRYYRHNLVATMRTVRLVRWAVILLAASILTYAGTYSCMVTGGG